MQADAETEVARRVARDKLTGAARATPALPAESRAAGVGSAERASTARTDASVRGVVHRHVLLSYALCRAAPRGAARHHSGQGWVVLLCLEDCVLF